MRNRRRLHLTRYACAASLPGVPRNSLAAKDHAAEVGFAARPTGRARQREALRDECKADQSGDQQVHFGTINPLGLTRRAERACSAAAIGTGPLRFPGSRPVTSTRTPNRVNAVTILLSRSRQEFGGFPFYHDALITAAYTVRSPCEL